MRRTGLVGTAWSAWSACAALALVACATQAAREPAMTTPGVRGAAVAPVDDAPRHVADDEPEPARAPAAVPEGEAWHHFFAAREAFDAMARGDADAARAALQALHHDASAGGAPEAWQAELARLGRAASMGAGARDMGELAAAVASAGMVCGDCHRAHAGRAVLAEGDTRGYRAGGRSGVSEEMARHQWPARQLWLGLSAPRDSDWARGVAGLGEGWTSLGGSMPPGFASARDALATAVDGERRAGALAQLLVQCAACHGP